MVVRYFINRAPVPLYYVYNITATKLSVSLMLRYKLAVLMSQWRRSFSVTPAAWDGRYVCICVCTQLVICILTGHAPVQRHLSLMGLINDPFCDYCNEEMPLQLFCNYTNSNMEKTKFTPQWYWLCNSTGNC